MKIGITYTRTINIGDEIQQNALIECLSRIDKEAELININRDTLHSLNDENISGLKLIINGWLCECNNDLNNYINKIPKGQEPNDFTNYDISNIDKNDVSILYIGIHITNGFAVFIKKNKAYKNHFKKHSPIGCRDTFTLGFFESLNIPCYLSGCLTLSFKSKNLNKIHDLTHSDSELNDPDANVIKHTIESSFEESKEYIEKRRNIAREIVENYEMSKNVITNRLHAYLPCLAFDVPVEIHDKNILKDTRFSGVELFENKDKRIELIQLQESKIIDFLK